MDWLCQTGKRHLALNMLSNRCFDTEFVTQHSNWHNYVALCRPIRYLELTSVRENVGNNSKNVWSHVFRSLNETYDKIYVGLYSFRIWDHSISSFAFGKSAPSNTNKVSPYKQTTDNCARVWKWLRELETELSNPTFIVLITLQSRELILKDWGLNFC